jgi:hypothetical protein
MTDNLRIWSQVEKTNPSHTKKVNQRGGFTAISAAYQIKRATEVFGPIGEGWGYDAGIPIFQDALVIVPVTLWHGDRANVFGPMFGGAEWKNGTRLDSDGPKKATTDALTKLLSQLGFNADVFEGRFDDSKYVAELEREFAVTISQDQADALRVEVEAVGGDAAKFLQLFGVASFEAVPADRWNEAVAKLEAKRMKSAA